jgi:hypothetical protein
MDRNRDRIYAVAFYRKVPDVKTPGIGICIILEVSLVPNAVLDEIKASSNLTRIALG